MIVGYKIPDPNSSYKKAVKRPFDGIGMLTEKELYNTDSEEKVFVCWEAKLLKKMSAFSMKLVEPHQNDYLSAYSEAKNVQSLLIVGMDCSRTDKRVYIFDWNTIKKFNLYGKGFSIYSKYLEKLPYSEVKKDTFKFSSDCIINENAFNKVYGDFKSIVDNWNTKEE